MALELKDAFELKDIFYIVGIAATFLIGLVNILLKISYILVWILPFIIIFLIIWYKQAEITGIFTRKKRKK